MKPFTFRYLLIAAFSCMMAACHMSPHEDTEPQAYQQLDKSIASGELATAENQLSALQAKAPNDERLQDYQHKLAEAYLHRSQVVLQKGDVNAAAAALIRARTLMPKAPALTSGVNGAMAQARKDELDKAEQALKLAESRPAPRLLVPTARSTTIELDTISPRKLREQMDDIAADAVAYDCDVSLSVTQEADFPWLSALMTRRLEDAGQQQPVVGRVIDPGQTARITLTPRRN